MSPNELFGDTPKLQSSIDSLVPHGHVALIIHDFDMSYYAELSFLIPFS